MGRRGPVPLTKQMLQLRGSWRADRNDSEPQARPGRPGCPKWLDVEAKRVWRRVVPELEFMGVLAKVDRQALARYCQLWSRWKRAEEFLQKYGDTYPLKDEKGTVRCFMPWPQIAIASKLAAALGRLEQELGLTPAARTRIRTDVSTLRRHNMGPGGPGGPMSIHEFMQGGGPKPPRTDV
jgi:P27 family predicted phage terminase small subunit